jgi:hypothetical protein
LKVLYDIREFVGRRLAVKQKDIINKGLSYSSGRKYFGITFFTGFENLPVLKE